jgi:hypothetical protein
MFRRVSTVVIVGVVAVGAALGAEGPPPIAFSLEAYRTRRAVGTPILVKITIRNTGEQDYEIVGDPGWGRWMSIASAREGEEFKRLRADAPEEHIMAGGLMNPIYRFTGTLAPGARQRILQTIRTTKMAPGRIRLKAILYQGHATGRHVIETAPITVELLTKLEDDEPPVLSAEEWRLVCWYVADFHNHLARSRRATGLPAIVRKALAGKGATPELEYALYAGALLFAQYQTTPEDLALAEEAARAFLARFPKSWLRAHAYAALAIVHTAQARRAIEAGQALPESVPLYENLRTRRFLPRTGYNLKTGRFLPLTDRKP